MFHVKHAAARGRGAGSSEPAGCPPCCVRYADLLVGAASTRGLIGPREAGRLWERHLLNCAVVAEPLPGRLARLADVGSGAGLPGLALALARPDLRCCWSSRCCAGPTSSPRWSTTLGLGQRRGGPGAGRGAARGARPTWSTARAVAPLDRLAGWCLPLVRPGGSCWPSRATGRRTSWPLPNRSAIAPARVVVGCEQVGSDVVEPRPPWSGGDGRRRGRRATDPSDRRRGGERDGDARQLPRWRGRRPRGWAGPTRSTWRRPRDRLRRRGPATRDSGGRGLGWPDLGWRATVGRDAGRHRRTASRPTPLAGRGSAAPTSAAPVDAADPAVVPDAIAGRGSSVTPTPHSHRWPMFHVKPSRTGTRADVVDRETGRSAADSNVDARLEHSTLA